MPFCADCGNQEPEEATFCSSCGQPMTVSFTAPRSNNILQQNTSVQNRDASTYIASKPEVMNHQKSMPYDHDRQRHLSHWWKCRRRHHQYHLVSLNGRTRAIALMLIVAILVGVIVEAWKTVPYIFHLNSNSPTKAETIRTFAVSNADNIYEITSGPDGNLWFIMDTKDERTVVGRITPAGSITLFPIPSGSREALGLMSGPDGNLWFNEFYRGKIGRITPAGKITEFTVQDWPKTIIFGPDGNLWFIKFNVFTIGRITPTGTITEFSIPATEPDAIGIGDITSGPDGNLWFTMENKIGRITPTGIITQFSNPGNPGYAGEIRSGPDGNLWFSETNKIERITPTGIITQLPLPINPARYRVDNIGFGPDGNLWFIETFLLMAKDKIGRITPTGQTAEFSIPTPDGHIASSTFGPDGNLWFTGSNVIGCIPLNKI